MKKLLTYVQICWDKQKVRLMDTLGAPLSRTLGVQCPFPGRSPDKILKDQRPVKALISTVGVCIHNILDFVVLIVKLETSQHQRLSSSNFLYYY
jgi:hypothetical protein